MFENQRRGLQRLLAKLGSDDPAYPDALLLEFRLRENIDRAELFGDEPTLQSRRAEVIDALNRLAMETIEVSFNSLCDANRNDEQRYSASADKVLVAPLDDELPLKEPPPHLKAPEGYSYLGRLDDLQSDHWYRRRDGHVAISFPEMPGVTPSFLIDKYAVTTQQFSSFLNSLCNDELALVVRPEHKRLTACLDRKGHPLVFDALEMWQRGPTLREPWLHAAEPWGLTYRSNTWQPVPGSELFPAAFVTWWGARLYGLWAHDLEISTSDDDPIFLPRSQQWQLAATFNPATRRGQLHPWGDTWNRKLVNYAGMWAGRDVHSPAGRERLWASSPEIYNKTRPLPVSDLFAGHSPIGCVQLLGNVWEWCADTVNEAAGKRAIKGGACISSQGDCSPGMSCSWQAREGSEYIGFRCGSTGQA